jgi:hypothetical protein
MPTHIDNGRRSGAPALSRRSAARAEAMTEDLPTFDEFVDELRRRLGAADALKPSELHDFHVDERLRRHGRRELVLGCLR